MINLLRGKCYDKIRDFSKAIEEYNEALKSCRTNKHNTDVEGNL